MLLLGLMALAALIGVFLYWQLVVAEGAYFGRRVVALLYNQFAPRYDAVKQFDPLGDAVMLAQPILRHLRGQSPPPTPPGGSREVVILDIATGTGRLPLALLSQPAFDGRVIALDSAGKMLEVARAKLAPYDGRVTFMLHDAQQLPFDDVSLDVVTCLEALEFFPNAASAICEMQRVLRPGGLLMLSNRIGPDAWKLPARATPTPQFVAQLREMGFANVQPREWLIDYDLVSAIK
ncbi:MAG TPA: methyltransferase domain-containing protein [Thermoflexales bacterium]|nr:methyltransferase domain-containing protein [Thermoflexales bacterium]HQW36855.1 methyltransferase domain-containing protein [Thermoflexales bacterium]HQZ23508.1 methyltransferase domain-containing protein [Thermoflexales bacterium]HQZ99593.1 methyltransferase domain-containing protein [Thermoflexales bacterium]